MKLYYRISDSSYKKPKLAGATKKSCLENFLKCFKNDNDCCLTVIADNCNSDTLDFLQSIKLLFLSTNFGNAGSLNYAIELAIKECEDEELIYFCEDDYLHLESAPKLLQEGIKRSDYVTLYDHPDKYTSQYNGGEFSKVIKTDSSHWRYTISTCMTFATKVKTLKEDLEIWKKYIDGSHPHDHLIFSDLNKSKRRRLAVCIPGAACHTDLEYSGRMKKVLIEPWAINLMINELIKKIPNINFDEWIGQKEGWEKLVALDAIVQNQ